MFFLGTLFLRVIDYFELTDSCLTIDLFVFLSDGPSRSERIDDYLLMSLLEIFFKGIACFFDATSGDLDCYLVKLVCRLSIVVWMEFCLDDILKFDAEC